MDNQIWQECKNQFQSELTKSQFNQYIKQIKLVGVDRLIVPNKFALDAMKTHGIDKLIRDRMRQLCGEEVIFDFIDDHAKMTNDSKDTIQLSNPLPNRDQNQPMTEVSLNHQQRKKRQQSVSYEYSSLTSIKSASIKSASIKSASIKSASIKSASIKSTSIESRDIHTIPFRPNKTFERFLSLNSNLLATASARDLVAGKLPESQLLIFGGSGLGKSFLLHSIANKMKAVNPMNRILFLDSKKFINQLMQSSRQQQVQAFKQQCCQHDVFLIDDVNIFIDKDMTLNVFTELLDFFEENNRPVVLTSNKRPSPKDFDDWIRNRLIRGAVAEIRMPDCQDRLKIVEKFAEEMQIPLADDCIRFIAENVKKSPNELKSVLSSIRMQLTVGLVQTIDLQDVKHVLNAFMLDEGIPITAELIINETAKYFSRRPDQLTGKSRKKHIVHARQAAMTLMKRLMCLNLSQIGDEFNRDHSTVLHSLKVMEKKCQEDINIDPSLCYIEEQIKQKLSEKI